jgi:hypothetical protein
MKPTRDRESIARIALASPAGPHPLPVAEHTAGCSCLAEEIVDGATRIVVAEGGLVSAASGGVPSDLAIAVPTETCALIPWTPPPQVDD